ncbi:MAG: lactate dehydrogenase [Oscillospiraceae bacterium]|nr:lactate dehydrogenase [Oscillospiraceae bacterium]
MGIFIYAAREFDELQFARQISEETGIGFGWSAEYPNPSNYELAKGYEGISVTPCDLSAPVLEAFHDLGVKYILCRSIGYDHVDLKRAKELGMRVGYVSYPPSGVANYAVMLMLMVCRRWPYISKKSQLQDYTLRGKIGLDLSMRTVGIIGTGKIGASVARTVSAMGCRCLAYDPYKNPSLEGIVEYVPFERLCAEADVITLHANVTEENYHLLNEAAFDLMKDDAIVINTSRGKLIDHRALIKTLEKGKLWGAALDVLENENGLYYYDRSGDVIVNEEMAALRSFPNVILSPHTAFYTTDAVYYMMKGCFDNYQAFSRGENPPLEAAAK